MNKISIVAYVPDNENDKYSKPYFKISEKVSDKYTIEWNGIYKTAEGANKAIKKELELREQLKLRRSKLIRKFTDEEIEAKKRIKLKRFIRSKGIDIEPKTSTEVLRQIYENIY